MELNDKTTLIILFLLLFSFSIGNAQEKKIRVKMPKTEKKQKARINPEAIKALQLGAPLEPSTSSHVSAYDVDDLTDELLHRKRVRKEDSIGVRPILGYSVFNGFYERKKPGDKLTVDWRWLTSDSIFIKMHPDRISLNSSIFASIGDFLDNLHKPRPLRKVQAPLYVKSYTPRGDIGANVDYEKILEAIFWRKAPDHWTHYEDISQSVLAQLPTLMPDSLVHLRMLNAADVSSVVFGASNKYKIVYFFCADKKGEQKDNFKRIISYVSSHKDKYYFIPISGADKLSNAASYLKHQGYFEKAYVVDRPTTLMRTLTKMSDINQTKEVPSYFVLNSSNKVIASGNIFSVDFGKLDSIVNSSPADNKNAGNKSN